MGVPSVSASMIEGSALFNERFLQLVPGHWLDSIGNSIIVSKCTDKEHLTAVLTPLIEHPDARDHVLAIWLQTSNTWRCGSANLEWADEQQQRIVWITGDGRRNIWSRTAGVSNEPPPSEDGNGSAFPWLIHNVTPEPWLPHDVPRDILYDGARVAALLDIRQLIGAKSEPQERLTHILMDHDLQPMRGDYLIPGEDSPLWQKLPVPDTTRRSIAQRISRIPNEALSQRVSWSGSSEVHVGHHKIACRARDIEALESRWVLQPKDPCKPLEIARLLALYSVFDNPLSNRRNGVHLGLDPDLRRQCDFELFASPLNAAVSNGRFASKWPHVEWRFGSIGSYPSVLSILPGNAIVCVNPPFTDAYLEDVMARIADLKQRFRLRVAMPIQEAAWRKKLQTSLPSAQLLRTYYDASAEHSTDVLHPTLLWEDPRCPARDEEIGEQQIIGAPMALPVLAPRALPIEAIAFFELPRSPDGNSVVDMTAGCEGDPLNGKEGNMEDCDHTLESEHLRAEDSPNAKWWSEHTWDHNPCDQPNGISGGHGNSANGASYSAESGHIRQRSPVADGGYTNGRVRGPFWMAPGSVHGTDSGGPCGDDTGQGGMLRTMVNPATARRLARRAAAGFAAELSAKNSTDHVLPKASVDEGAEVPAAPELKTTAATPQSEAKIPTDHSFAKPVSKAAAQALAAPEPTMMATAPGEAKTATDRTPVRAGTTAGAKAVAAPETTTTAVAPGEAADGERAPVLDNTEWPALSLVREVARRPRSRR
mmetsp:Transcript_18380/g.50435  ORF Transcript_18380/g.50435 Transcript_18380/m.50435 type:complete len:764 (+) Transcript_18380:316-2607(+)